MKVTLALLEARLQALIEGSAARLFPYRESPPNQAGLDSFGRDLAGRLVTAMRASLRLRSDGSYWAPNLFTLAVHPSQAQALGENSGLIEALSHELQRAGTGGEFSFPSPPVVNVLPDADLSMGEVRIQATFNMEHLFQTSSLEGKLEAPASQAPTEGFLIVEGARTFPIEAPVVNIGRSAHNDLVIDDLRVSREHAQLRAIHGRYVIFDLDSTGGTFINGQRVIQSVLYPGDVISLAGVMLIFSQDMPFPTGDTQPYPPEEG